MKNIHIIGFLVVLSFLLAMAGCGDKETEQPVQPAQPVEETEEPELPEEGVQEVPAVTEQEAAPEEPAAEPAEEPAAEPAPVDELAAEDKGTALTAENYRVVSLKDLKAYPEEMHIKVGTTVEWRNVNDNLQHIIGWSGQKQSGVKPEPIKQGESWSYTFMKPGKITWFSTARPTIQGVIYVEE